MSETHSTDFAKQLELAWAAGFFDGEGSTYLRLSSRKDKTYVTASVSQVELEPLHRFHRAIGGIGSIKGPYLNGKKRLTAKPIYKWMCVGFPAKQALQLLWPYLSEVKRVQATRVMEQEINTGKPAAATRTHCPQGHSYADHGVLVEAGHRRCRLCMREQSRLAQRRYKAKQKKGE